MPPRPSHLPNNIERSALQKMSPTHGLPLAKLHPAGRKTIAGMVAKGWIDKVVDANAGAGFCITPAGKAALEAKIPTDRSGR